MALNRELFQKIHTIITSRGETEFDMQTWEGVHLPCGTTRCVAGWAVALTTESDLYAPLIHGDLGRSVSEATRTLARRLREEDVHVLGDDDFEEMGAHLLGLTSDQRRLFYTDNERAAEFVKAAAKGDLEAVDRITEEMK